jgi:multicomponent Na+:H+ antiporter subunit G
VLVLIGVFFVVAGSIGIIRLPDVYNRLHAASKSSTLGVAGIVLASLLFFGMTTGVYSGKKVLTIFFIFLTAPAAGQMISRAAYQVGVKLWDKSVLDELAGKYSQVRAKRDNDY